MKTCTKCKENKELKEFGKERRVKDGHRSICKKCRSIESKKNYQDNKKRVDIQHTEYREANPDYQPNYYKQNSQKIRIRSARWYSLNKDKVRERDRGKKQNPEKVNARAAHRRASKLNATPKWLTKEHKAQIQAIYTEATRLTKETGIPRHVDHIVPLQGKNVSGLHVPWNLQILTAAQNASKGNRIL